jgi:Arm DNA-binding domain
MLTDKHCKNAACDTGKLRVRLADSDGLYLEVAPFGSKRWFWKYRFDGNLAILEPDQVGELMRAIGGYKGQPIT